MSKVCSAIRIHAFKSPLLRVGDSSGPGSKNYMKAYRGSRKTTPGSRCGLDAVAKGEIFVSATDATRSPFVVTLPVVLRHFSHGHRLTLKIFTTFIIGYEHRGSATTELVRQLGRVKGC